MIPESGYNTLPLLYSFAFRLVSEIDFYFSKEERAL